MIVFPLWMTSTEKKKENGSKYHSTEIKVVKVSVYSKAKFYNFPNIFKH